jgi:hypothetical protein
VGISQNLATCRLRSGIEVEASGIYASQVCNQVSAVLLVRRASSIGDIVVDRSFENGEMRLLRPYCTLFLAGWGI